MPEGKGEQNGEQGSENNSNSTTDSKHTATDTGSGNSSGEANHDNKSIREMVREEIKEALKGIKPEDNTPQPRRNDIEAAAEKMVRDASERLRAQEEHAKDHERLRTGEVPKTDDKPEPEAAPKKVRKLTKILWGSDD